MPPTHVCWFLSSVMIFCEHMFKMVWLSWKRTSLLNYTIMNCLALAIYILYLPYTQCTSIHHHIPLPMTSPHFPEGTGNCTVWTPGPVGLGSSSLGLNPICWCCRISKMKDHVTHYVQYSPQTALILVLVQYIDIAIYRFINKHDTTQYSNCTYRYIVIQGQSKVKYFTCIFN